jgi:hypothetical protein
MSYRVAAVLIGAAGAARAAATTARVRDPARIAIANVAAAMTCRIGGILIGDLGMGGAGAEHGERGAPDNGTAGDATEK